MDDDFEARYAAALAAGRKGHETEPRAAKARYNARRRRLEIELVNGCTASFPIDLIQDLGSASDEDLAQVEIDGAGSGLHWENLDADFGVAGLMAGVFGTRKWMDQLRARRAGSATSPAKAAAARANGAKGGRPRKTAASRNQADF